MLSTVRDLAGALLGSLAGGVVAWRGSVAGARAAAGVLVLLLSYLIDRKRGRS